jgi:hypothetical protein
MGRGRTLRKTWTKEDDSRADRKGWSIFEVSRRTDGWMSGHSEDRRHRQVSRTTPRHSNMCYGRARRGSDLYMKVLLRNGCRIG